jgi:hypothetical protein
MYLTSRVTSLRRYFRFCPLVAIASMFAVTVLLASRLTSPTDANIGPFVNSVAVFDRDALTPHSTQERKQQATTAYENLPLTFIENRGQLQPRVHYYGHRGNFGVYFTRDEIMFFLEKRSPLPAVALHASHGIGGSSRTHIVPTTLTHAPGPHTTAWLTLKFLHPNPHSTLIAQKREPGIVNYFHGADPAKWRLNLPQYSEMVYRDLWPKIDLRLREQTKALKYEFRVRPGAKISNIRLVYAGALDIRLDDSGALLVQTAAGLLRDVPPIAYQQIAGSRVPVESHYLLNSATGEYGFAVGSYQSDHELIVDPGVSYSTFLGGSADEQGSSIAVDASGNTYITGVTQSPDFPATAGAFRRTGAVSNVPDAFVAKLNPTGTALVYATFLGGSDLDIARAIAIDGGGNAYIAGQTKSTDFPTTKNAFDRTLNTPGKCPRCNIDNYDAFVTKLNPTGSKLVYSTYLGGGQDIDDAFGIAVDSAGSAYVTGETASPDFPTTPHAFRTVIGGSNDAFVTKLNTTGSALVYSTFVGGSQVDFSVRIQVDSAGNAYVIGNTSSLDFPTTPGAFDTTANGGFDVFVMKLNAAGSNLVYSTFLGGSGFDSAGSIAIDSMGNAYAVGGTNSGDFPTTPGAFQTVSPRAGGGGGFVSKLNATGSALVYSTFLGDSGCSGVVITPSGNAWITGGTSSDTFPITPDAFQAFHHPSPSTPSDAFITELNSTGSALLYSTYLGGTDTDFGNDLGLDSAGNVYVTGVTRSADFPITPGAFDPVFKGRQDIFWGDAFITELALNGKSKQPPPPTVALLSPSVSAITGGNSFSTTVFLSGGAEGSGAVVALASSNLTLLTVPGSITIPTGAQSGTFISNTATVTVNTPVSITASYNNSSKAATVTLLPPPGPAALSSLGFFPNTVTGGNPALAIVGLTNPAPVGGFLVSLSSNNSAATPPPSVTVPAGQQTFSFSVPTSIVVTSTGLSVFATAGGRTAIGTLTVNPPDPPPATVTLTVSATGRTGESVISSPAGINVPVGSSMQASFTQGTAITLTVSNGRSAIWSGGCSSGGSKTGSCIFTLNAASSVSANVQ